jgi:hypothetical protein
MDNTLHVFLSSSTDQSLLIKCVDAPKKSWLLGLGLASVSTNVKVSASSTMIFTATSGVRFVQHQQQRKPDSQNPVIETTEKTKPTPTKWTCLVCNCLNHASKGVCFSCNLSRKEGPSGPLWLFKKGLNDPPYSYETWNCDICFARKNSPTSKIIAGSVESTEPRRRSESTC